MKESLVYYSVLVFGKFVCVLPLKLALCFGRFIGLCFYRLDSKNRGQVYSNLKIAFAREKSPVALKKIAKQMYRNYGMSVIDMFRLPLLKPENIKELVEIEGKEHIIQARQKGNGVILLGMHAGSWEMANVACAMLEFPYTLFANVQKKFSKLNTLLNSYRTCGGSVVLNQGSAVRDIVAALKNNGVVGMVIDQGGRNGDLVNFFGRSASMNAGVLRLALKYKTPIIFSTIHRTSNGRHKMTFSAPIEMDGQEHQEVAPILAKVVGMMEAVIKKHPAEYMWIYKIWKYSKEARFCILSDGKMGHQRQSESVGLTLTEVLQEKRDIVADTTIIKVTFKNQFMARVLSVWSVFYMPLFIRGRLEFLKYFLEKECLEQLLSINADYIISCGSSMAGLNFFLSKDHNAKSIVILKPGLLSYNCFDLVVLPQHDAPSPMKRYRNQFAITYGALNLISDQYLATKTAELLNQFSHLKSRVRTTIGIFIGGSTKRVYVSDKQIKVLIRQLHEIAKNLNADVLITTSRRTPHKIDQMLKNAFKSNKHFPLLILPNEEYVDAAVGGIMGLSDMLIVSGDSLSMVSEAATSGKKTIVFSPMMRGGTHQKHWRFIKKLSQQGFIMSVDVTNIGQHVYDISKNKITTQRINDKKIVYDGLCEVI